MTATLPARTPSSDAEVGALFDAHAEELCRMVHRMTGSREVAEEVVQEVFVTAWQRKGDLAEIGNPRAWLYRVATNHLRHRRRSFARLANFLDRYKTRPEEPTELPDAEVARIERAQKVHDAVARMSPKQREVFVLFELQELSGAEVAEVLGIKPNTMWGRLRLARESFRGLFELEEDER